MVEGDRRAGASLPERLCQSPSPVKCVDERLNCADRIVLID
jgi:hypothetical protein